MLCLHVVDSDDGGVLDVFETIAHELDAAEPASHTDNSTPYIVLLEHAKNHHAGASLTIVVFSFVDDSFVLNAGGKAVVIGAHIGLISFKGFEEGFDILATLYTAVADTIAATPVLDDLLEEYKGGRGSDAVSKGKGGGGHRGKIV